MQPSLPVAAPASSFQDDTGEPWTEITDREEYVDDEPEKPSWKNMKAESISLSNPDDKLKRSNGQSKWMEPPKAEPKRSSSEDDLTALLKVKESIYGF